MLLNSAFPKDDAPKLIFLTVLSFKRTFNKTYKVGTLFAIYISYTTLTI